MQDLKIRFYESSSRPRVNKGGNIPPWLDNETDINTWYKDSGKNFFFNIVDDETIYIQHGLNESGWAGVLFLSQTLNILNQVKNDDSSITVTYDVKPNFFISRIAPVSIAGWQVETDVFIGNERMYRHVGNTRENYSYGAKPKITNTVTIQPEQEFTGSALKLTSFYPNGESPTNTLIVGFSLYNPNPPIYIPMATRKNGNWKDLNSNNGHILIRKSNSWIDKSQESFATSRQIDKGKNRIRKSGNWRQLPRMSGKNTP